MRPKILTSVSGKSFRQGVISFDLVKKQKKKKMDLTVCAVCMQSRFIFTELSFNMEGNSTIVYWPAFSPLCLMFAFLLLEPLYLDVILIACAICVTSRQFHKPLKDISHVEDFTTPFACTLAHKHSFKTVSECL